MRKSLLLLLLVCSCNVYAGIFGKIDDIYFDLIRLLEDAKILKSNAKKAVNVNELKDEDLKRYTSFQIIEMYKTLKNDDQVVAYRFLHRTSKFFDNARLELEKECKKTPMPSALNGICVKKKDNDLESNDKGFVIKYI